MVFLPNMSLTVMLLANRADFNIKKARGPRVAPVLALHLALPCLDTACAAIVLGTQQPPSTSVAAKGQS